jgi:polysaccharide pyruvyl transferase WcaK-like protein
MKANFIALFGEWNTTNIGDRAIGFRATEYLLSFGFRVRLFALGSFHYLGDVSDASQLDAFFSSPENVTTRARSVKHKLVHKYLPRIKFLFRFFRNYLNREQVQIKLSECVAAVVGGGALLDDDNLHFPSSLFLVKISCKRLTLPLYTLGCSSAGKFSILGRLILRDFLRYATMIAVRDSSSKAVLQPLSNKQIFFFGDFAFGTTVKPRSIIRPTKVAFNVMHFWGSDKGLHPGYEFFLQQILSILMSREDLDVTLFTTGDTNDKAMALKVHARVNSINEVFHPRNFSELSVFLKSKDVVLCSRLHAAIIAISEGTPAIALWSTPKAKNFFHTIGLHEYCIRATPQDSLEQMINEIIDVKLLYYFNQLNVADFEEGRDQVSSTLCSLARATGLTKLDRTLAN